MTLLTIPFHLPSHHTIPGRVAPVLARRIADDCDRLTSWHLDLTTDTLILDLPGVAREDVEKAVGEHLPAGVQYSVGEAS
ncbi:hypothetical protein [Cellulomonas composti]|uniref:HMA domain-containing protein n=1 Tax=Cellulomonas composti TaxID=266130 RepID=A0A511JBP4_9CELL|nr:hypothetical protein [Cellulomonas composti]GEL95384.1 hypothetical protein CCO02nite_20420 [Cellulomonas composti]